ncbi:Serine/threonine-protein phosphatase 6 regulatory ankyrin repeat subunit, partial [Globisporangium polare]
MVDRKKVNAVHWKSPEYLRGERPAITTDIYSFAMCILEVATGEVPWGRNALAVSVRSFVKKGKIPHRPDTLNDKQWNLIELMTKGDASKRV